MTDNTMPHTTPTRPITIQGQQFAIRWPYSEGHVCSAVEAEALNKARAENVRNNFSKQVERAKAQAESSISDHESADNLEKALAMLPAEFAEYDASYEFGLLSPRSMDPIGRESQRIAQIVVREQLNRAGKTEDDVEDTALRARVAAIALSPAVRAEATRRLDAMSEVAESALAELS